MPDLLTECSKPKRAKPFAANARALADLRKMGFTAQKVEMPWNHYTKVTLDLFGCIDIIAVREGIGILGVQATSGANHAARVTKALAEPRLKQWLAAGGRFEVWSYRLAGAKGKRKVYELRREEIKIESIVTA